MHAMNWVKQLGYLNVEFESDVKLVVDDIRVTGFNATKFGSLVQDCR